ALLVFDPKALLLVDNYQAQIFELDVFGEQAVGADCDVDSALGQIHYRSLQLLGRAKPAEHLHAHREGLEAAFEGFEMLKYQYCSWRQDNDLLAVPEGFKSGAHDDFGLAESNVATEQAIHGLRALHIPLDLGNGGNLVAGGGEFEGVLKLALPITIRRVDEAFGHLAGGIKFKQLVGHVAHFGFDARLGAGPGGTAHAVERGFGLARAAEALHQVHAGERQVELGPRTVFQDHVIAFIFTAGDLAQAEVQGDAVFRVDHVIAGLEVDDIGGKGLARGLGRRAAGDQFGGLEEVLRPE